MVKSKIFADANITNILNIRKFFAIFLKKRTPKKAKNSKIEHLV